jgi:hypothetical protein
MFSRSFLYSQTVTLLTEASLSKSTFIYLQGLVEIGIIRGERASLNISIRKISNPQQLLGYHRKVSYAICSLRKSGWKIPITTKAFNLQGILIDTTDEERLLAHMMRKSAAAQADQMGPVRNQREMP